MTENLAGRGEGLAVALKRIVAVASGEEQVAVDDTAGMAWIDKFARAALEAAAPPSTAQATGETSDGYHTFNELYEHRHALFSVICATFGGWKATLHEDGTMFDGWFIAGVQTPLGQATSHLPLSWWEHFKCDVRVHAPKWDGHTAADVPKRIAALATPSPQAPDNQEGAGWTDAAKGAAMNNGPFPHLIRISEAQEMVAEAVKKAARIADSYIEAKGNLALVSSTILNAFELSDQEEALDLENGAKANATNEIRDVISAATQEQPAGSIPKIPDAPDTRHAIYHSAEFERGVMSRLEWTDALHATYFALFGKQAPESMKACDISHAIVDFKVEPAGSGALTGHELAGCADRIDLIVAHAVEKKPMLAADWDRFAAEIRRVGSPRKVGEDGALREAAAYIALRLPENLPLRSDRNEATSVILRLMKAALSLSSPIEPAPQPNLLAAAKLILPEQRSLTPEESASMKAFYGKVYKPLAVPQASSEVREALAALEDLCEQVETFDARKILSDRSQRGHVTIDTTRAHRAAAALVALAPSRQGAGGK